MKYFVLLFLFFLSNSILFACCVYDGRLVSQRILEKEAGNIIWCRALHDSNISGSGDFLTNMEVIKVFFGKTEGEVISLRSGSEESSVGGTFIKAGSEWLIFDGAGRHFYGGTICDIFFCEVSTEKGQYTLQMLDTLSSYMQQKKTGNINIRYKNGKTALLGSFIDGIQHGEWKHFAFNDWLNDDYRIFVNHYNMGQLEGEQITYYDEKHIKTTAFYQDGKRQGKSLSYHSNGNIAAIQHYENGIEVDESQYFAENGNILFISGKGNKLITYYPNIAGQVKQIQKYVYQDTTHIIFTDEYTEKGFLLKQIQVECLYTKSGKHLGNYYEYEYKLFHPNTTQLKEIGTYHLGKKVGIWKKYDIDGNLIKEENFSP